jgi:hypothetical protein
VVNGGAHGHILGWHDHIGLDILMPEELWCTICAGPFDIELEGGVEGFIGVLPVAFCPTCKTGIFDFAEQMGAGEWRTERLDGLLERAESIIDRYYNQPETVRVVDVDMWLGDYGAHLESQGQSTVS